MVCSTGEELVFAFDAHAVETTVYEDYRYSEEDHGEARRQGRTLLGGEIDGHGNGQQSEQRGELDDRVEGHTAGVLEGIANRVADYAGIMQRSALGPQFGFHDFLRVIPCTAGIGHEDGLVQTEQGDGDEVAYEEEGFEERERKGCEEYHQEDVEHAFLGILGADFDHLLGIFDGSLLFGIELDVLLDEFHRAVGAGGDGLGAGAGEPVDDGAACNEAEQEGRVHQGDVDHVLILQTVSECHDCGENHGGGADHGGADEHRLGRGLARIGRGSGFFQVFLGLFEVRFETEGLLNVGLDDGHGFEGGKFVDGLGVVGDGAVAIHRDGDRTHAEEPEGDQTEGGDGGSQQEGGGSEGHHGAHEVADAHE